MPIERNQKPKLAEYTKGDAKFLGPDSVARAKNGGIKGVFKIRTAV